MTKNATRKLQAQAKPGVVRFPETNPYASHPKSEVSWVFNQIKKGNLSPKRLALMDGDGSMDVAQFLLALDIVSNPLHPENNWSSVVEEVMFEGEVYLRLAREIPVAMKEYWIKNGRPPRVGWGYTSKLSNAEFPTARCSSSSPNPYPQHIKYHSVFELSREWRPMPDLVDRIASRLYGQSDRKSRRKAHNIWNEVARPDRNGNRSCKEERTTSNGIKEVRVVSLVGQ